MASRSARSAEELSGFFFFQADDGIRDYKVTGVQTCALPIFAAAAHVAVELVTARLKRGQIYNRRLLSIEPNVDPETVYSKLVQRAVGHTMERAIDVVELQRHGLARRDAEARGGKAGHAHVDAVVGTHGVRPHRAYQPEGGHQHQHCDREEDAQPDLEGPACASLMPALRGHARGAHLVTPCGFFHGRFQGGLPAAPGWFPWG